MQSETAPVYFSAMKTLVNQLIAKKNEEENVTINNKKCGN